MIPFFYIIQPNDLGLTFEGVYTHPPIPRNNFLLLFFRSTQYDTGC